MLEPLNDMRFISQTKNMLIYLKEMKNKMKLLVWIKITFCGHVVEL
jgi:hypothetical protein